MSMPPQLPLGVGLLVVIALAAIIARRLQVPHAIVLVVIGLMLAIAPGLPGVELDPTLVLLLLLPPLLYSSGVSMSWRGFEANLQPIILLAIGCVLFTATAAAAASHWLLGLPWAASFLLGAVVSPPDAVAPMAIMKRFSVPGRILRVLQGEGLVNDATALILFSFALRAIAEGGISIPAAAGSFVAIVSGELAYGLAVGWTMLRLRALLGNPQAEIVLALLTPYATFWPPEAIGGSGVLATVAAGLYVSWNGRRFIAPATRLQGYFVWDLVVFVIEGLMFLLMGLQARMVVQSLDSTVWRELLIAGGMISILVIVVRLVWVYAATYLPRLLLASKLGLENPAPSWRHTFLIGFTGVRGVVSLAAALSIPLTIGGQPFPERDLILFVTFCVIVATLIGQGLTLPWLIRRLGLENAGRLESDDAKSREVAARVRGVDAALDRLSELEADGASPLVVRALRRHHVDRRAHLVATGDDAVEGSLTADSAALQLRLVEAERDRVGQDYSHGALSDEARRRIERELDLEDARVRHTAESAVGPVSAE